MSLRIESLVTYYTNKTNRSVVVHVDAAHRLAISKEIENCTQCRSIYTSLKVRNILCELGDARVVNRATDREHPGFNVVALGTTFRERSV